MIKEIKSHFLEYLILGIILILGFGMFLYFSYDRQTQVQIGILVSFAYGLWGIIHHYAERSLNWKIMVEYSLLAAISAIIISSLVLRS